MIGFVFGAAVAIAPFAIWFFFRGGGYKRKLLNRPPGSDFSFSGERFIDPRSGQLVEVWTRISDGDRAYVLARGGAIDAGRT